MKNWIRSLDFTGIGWDDVALWLWCALCAVLMVTAAIQEQRHPHPQQAERSSDDDLMDAVLMHQLFFNSMNQ